VRNKRRNQRVSLAREGLRLRVPPPKIEDTRPSRAAEKAKIRREMQEATIHDDGNA